MAKITKMIQPANLLMLFSCRDGETGRRSGLKIRRGQKPCGGSIPPPGTTLTHINIEDLNDSHFLFFGSKLPCFGCIMPEIMPKLEIMPFSNLLRPLSS